MSPRAIMPRAPGLEGAEVQLGGDQPVYLELPALVLEPPQGTTVLTRWRLSPEELRYLNEGADLFLSVLTFGQPFQPVLLTVGWPSWTADQGPPPTNEAGG